MDLNQITSEIISCSIEVHKNLGPGLLEKIYEKALCIEFERKGLKLYSCFFRSFPSWINLSMRQLSHGWFLRKKNHRLAGWTAETMMRLYLIGNSGFLKKSI